MIRWKSVLVSTAALALATLAVAAPARAQSNRPTVAILDPFQLPPVKGEEGYFARNKPHARLTEVHRQARDNPILAFAH